MISRGYATKLYRQHRLEVEMSEARLIVDMLQQATDQGTQGIYALECIGHYRDGDDHATMRDDTHESWYN